MSSPIVTPGSQALEAIKNIKDLAVFKKPLGPARRSKKFRPKTLDEDTYIEKMGEIIQRDFFPHLEKLKAQNDYLDAIEQNDAKKMRDLYTKYSSGQPLTERITSPATFETPLREDTNNLTKNNKDSQHCSTTGENTTDNKTQVMGLDVYLSTHTSEDNASFEEMMEEANKRQRIKYAWLYKMEENSQAPSLNANENTLSITDSKSSKPLMLDTWNYRNKNYIMYIPDGVELTPEEKIEMAKRKQEIIHSNTRLNTNPFNEKHNKETLNELAKSQLKVYDGKIGVDGKEVIRNLTPKVNGFSFVATPSPRPEDCESPLMTWGEIEGTPFRLDGGDTPILRSNQGPSFRMAEPPKREKLALQLAEKAGERHRDRKSKALEAARKSFATPSPRCLSTIDRLSTMSPAARRLATQKLRIVGTPSPRRTLLRSPSIGVKTHSLSHRATPNHTSLKEVHSDGTSKSKDTILTDNLLNLPQRQRASDFFN
ncbi:Similar to Es2: Splicing factor ESS-2 homolog (Drosophila melanogaster) [Cotesia congregata]|uniref:Similar to Es2: Splicing factor ESS-2 homolog (Drosophila melanogaster) n=1 Tax=Cotesia congregata TaxID=51543 RepID=A0A8J2MRZ8_COTCN|nr:Similar to Es2: Splicing factor ESS-2 homolog (Drosophila melanogaster) [Cotesia congregata]